MLEWLVTIGTTELGKAVFKQGLKLGQTAAEDYVKDFFKGCLRQTTLNALLNHYSTHPKTLELLRDRAENDPDEQLRQWAQEQLKMQNIKLEKEDTL